jgi:hypothetical protein
MFPTATIVDSYLGAPVLKLGAEPTGEMEQVDRDLW